MKAPLGEPTQHSQRWATAAELKQPVHAWRPGNLILGQGQDGQLIGYGYSNARPGQDDRHALTVAAPRSGKGLQVIQPNLLTYPGSMFVIDPKGEHAKFELETGARRAMGHQVFYLDPFDVLRGPSDNPASAPITHSYNPLAGLTAKAPNLHEVVALVADALIVGDDKDPYWTDGARGLVELILHWMVSTPEGGPPSLVRLRKVLAGSEAPVDLGIEDNLIALASQADGFNPTLAELGRSFLGIPSKSFGTFVSVANRQLQFMRYPQMEKVLRDPTGAVLNLAELKSRPITVYAVIPAKFLTSHARWLRLLVMQVLAALESDMQPKHQVVLLLEEFGVLGHMETIAKTAAYLPGFGVKLWMILQNLEQLSQLYPRQWLTLLDGCGSIQLFGIDPSPSNSYILDRLGQRDLVRLEATNASIEAMRSGATLTREERRRVSLMEAHEIGVRFSRDPDSEGRYPMLLLRKGQPPAHIFRLPHNWRPSKA